MVILFITWAEIKLFYFIFSHAATYADIVRQICVSFSLLWKLMRLVMLYINECEQFRNVPCATL